MKVLGKANPEPKLDKDAVFTDPKVAAMRWLEERMAKKKEKERKSSRRKGQDRSDRAAVRRERAKRKKK